MIHLRVRNVTQALMLGVCAATAAQGAQVTDNSNLASLPTYFPSPWGTGAGEWADAYQKARNFVSQLTLLEKVNLTTGIGNEQGNCVGETGSVPRLNFSGICFQDSPTGVGSTDYFVSAFPPGVNVAASFSRDLAYRRGYAMASEHRRKGVDVQLGPVVGPLGRTPEGGRNWEGFGRDPVSAGILGAETIKGMQDAGVVACIKHYIRNEQEHFRLNFESATYGQIIPDSLSSNIDDKTIHELYLWPFADAVRAGVGAVMCSYTQINNTYGCDNSYTMNKLLKAELGFQGFVVTDWNANYSGISSTFAGLDVAMPVLNGTLPEWRLDNMVTRLVAAFYKVGRDHTRVPVNFNSWSLDQYGYAHYLVEQGAGTLTNQYVDVRGNHSELIRELGAKSIVLLKNKGALPLMGNEKFTAIIGNDSGSRSEGPNGCAYSGCDDGTLASGWGSGSGVFSYLITPEQAIINEVRSRGKGVVNSITDNSAVDAITSLAHLANVAIVFVNANSGEGFIEVDGNYGDRKNLTLWQGGDALIPLVASECNNTIVVMHTVGPVLVTDWYDHPNVTAIVWAGLPGEQSGNSLVDVLYGRVNPGGKTPFTWGKSLDSWSSHVDTTPTVDIAPQQDFVEGVLIDYRDFDHKNETPIYEFGYGLSYTQFQFSNLSVVPLLNASKYVLTTGYTEPVSRNTNNISNYINNYLFPDGIEANRIPLFIYPWPNSTDLSIASGNPSRYGAPSDSWIPPSATNGSAQPLLAAGGGPGGNPTLYEPLYSVSVHITNTGSVDGDEVPQLYLSLGGPDDPKIVLRNFDRITIPAGESYTWSINLTRRDISNWDPVREDWVVSNYTKTAFVGSSSRKLPLSARLPSFTVE